MAGTEKTGDRYLDQEINDLFSVDATGHSDSTAFTNLKNAISRLTNCVSKYYPKGNEPAPKLGTEELDELRKAYSETIRECGKYTSGKWFGRKSGLGAGRMQCVNSLRRLLEGDLRALGCVKPTDGTDLSSVISTARTVNIRTDAADYDLKTFGESVSTRVPLEVETATGPRKGFFTEDFTIRQPTDFCRDLIKEYGLDLNDKNGLGCILKSVSNMGIVTNVNNDRFPNLVFALLSTEEARKKNGITLEKLEEDPKLFAEHYRGFFNEMRLSAKLYKDLQNSQEMRRKFINLTQDIYTHGVNYVNNVFQGHIPVGGNVPNRNVGVSRIADFMGMGELVARAVRTTIRDKDGVERTGVFQEAAQGSDLHHVKKNDPLLEIGKNPKMLDDPSVLKKIADLQLLDYICGNNDRHEGNVMFDVREVNGEMKIVGLKAIDNDRALGTIDKNSAAKEGYITPPEMMGVISASAYGALDALDKNELSMSLRDLGISNEEIEFAIKRIGDVKKAVQDKKLTVLEDHEFANYKFEDLGKSWTVKANGMTFHKDNLFRILSIVPQKVADMEPVSGEKDVQYNTAKAEEGRYERVNTELNVYLSDLTAQKAELMKISENLKSADHWYHVDGATFKWMKTSLENAVSGIKALEKTYAGNERAAITAEEAEKMEALFRQMRLSSAKYISEHPSPGHPLGQARRRAADSLVTMRPLRCTEPAVMDIGMDKIRTEKKEMPAPAAPRKKQMLQKTIRETRQKKSDQLKLEPPKN